MPFSKQIKIIECVANVSHGYQDEVLAKLTEAIRGVEGQKLLDIDSSPSANRTVFTFAGEMDAVGEAAFELYKMASRYVDMRKHKGNHPRIGSIDVCPFVPLKGYTRNEVINFSQEFAKRVGEELNIPVYLYELSASHGFRCQLPDIRKGEYEGLARKMLKSRWIPDFGPHIQSGLAPDIRRTGATIIGCRRILVAFNISLNTTSKEIARKIAYRIRSSGWPRRAKKERGELCLKLPKVRAIGWYSEDYGQAQVSCNILRYKKTSPLTVWEAVKQLAKEYGCEAVGCEVIGLLPEETVLEAGRFAMAERGLKTALPKRQLVKLGVKHFQFNEVRPFDLSHKILEYRYKEISSVARILD